MTKAQKIAIAVFAIFVPVNIWFMYGALTVRRRHHDHNAERIQIREEQRARWHTDPGTPLNSAGLDQVVLTIPSTPACLTSPVGAVSVPVKDLPVEQRDDLYAAIAGILRAYTEATPEAVYSYMAGRNERFAERNQKYVKAALKSGSGVPMDKLDAMSPEEVFKLFWREVKVKPHWSEIVVGSCCLDVCLVDTYDERSLNEPAMKDHGIWQEVSTNVHHFSPDRTFGEELKQVKSVPVATVRVVIRHDSELLRGASPYYFRFWYDSSCKRWHPLAMARIAAFEEAPVGFVF